MIRSLSRGQNIKSPHWCFVLTTTVRDYFCVALPFALVLNADFYAFCLILHIYIKAIDTSHQLMYN